MLGADVAFLRLERLPPTGSDAQSYIAGAPDLMVEIVSSSQFKPEQGAKAWLWLQRGARLVWFVWPKREEVDVWIPGEEVPITRRIDDVLDRGQVLPGFRYALADLFA